MLTDTHVHLADPQLSGRLKTVLDEAAAVGVRRFVVPSAEKSDWPNIAALSGGRIIPAFGIHPWFADRCQAGDFNDLAEQLAHFPQALVGETGLDYRRAANESERESQRQALLGHIRTAAAFRRPLILHNVGATQDLIRLLKQETFPFGGFAHAFSGSLEEAREFIRLGFKIGLGSLLLNPNAQKVRRAAAELPSEHFVLETDSPFMLHKQTNTPANLRRIAEIIAELRGCTVSEIAEQSEHNADSVLAFAYAV